MTSSRDVTASPLLCTLLAYVKSYCKWCSPAPPNKIDVFTSFSLLWNSRKFPACEDFLFYSTGTSLWCMIKKFNLVSTDKNECIKADRCHANAECTNSPGSYSCKCKPGYSGDGKTSCTSKYHCILVFCILVMQSIVFVENWCRRVKNM
jgi:hypothetical protein